MRQLFKDHQEKLSYFDFFTYLKQINVNVEKDWEVEAIVQRLDSQAMAFIEFNEFNEFLEIFGFKTGEPVQEEDEEYKLELEQAISYLDYKLTKNDFYMQSPTMFKSEKAALAFCTQEFKKLKSRKNADWFDMDFGPKSTSDFVGSARALYPNGDLNKIPVGYTKPEEIDWIWSKDRVANRDVKFVE